MRILSVLKDFGRSRSGNIAIIAALAAPLLIGSLAISIDYGALSLQRRNAQTVADLAAIAAASAPDRAHEMLLYYFKDNQLNYALENDGRYVFPDGRELPKSAAHGIAECLVSWKMGTYLADPSVSVTERFRESSSEKNAVEVTMNCPGKLYFATMLGDPPMLEVRATAAVKKSASFWIGSRLASLNGGILNAVLGAMLGSEVSLSVSDYRALLDVNIELLSFLQTLKTEANLTAATYEDVLNAQVGMGQVFSALRKSGQVSASTGAILKSLQSAAYRNTKTLSVGKVINMEGIDQLAVGSPMAGTAYAGLFDIVSAAALVSGGKQQLLSGLAIQVPGLAQLTINAAVGERPVLSQSIAVGQPGSRVRTAQVRIKLDAKIGGLLSLLGTSVNLPVYVEVANAEARLTAINCQRAGPSGPSVEIEAVPGVAEIAIGTVKPDAFINFADAPRVAEANLVTTPALKISGSAQVDIKNLKSKMLAFSAHDIRDQRIRSVSTSTPLTSALSSLVDNLHLKVDVLGIKLGIAPSVSTASLRSTISSASQALDSVLYNTLLALGVRIGEVDVGVTGVQCKTPALVL